MNQNTEFDSHLHIYNILDDKVKEIKIFSAEPTSENALNYGSSRKRKLAKSVSSNSKRPQPSSQSVIHQQNS